MCISNILSFLKRGKKSKHVLDGDGMFNTHYTESFSVSRSCDSYAQQNFYLFVKRTDDGYTASGTLFDDDGTEYNTEEGISLSKSACRAIDELMSAYFEDDYSVQWYRDGKALEGATDLSLSFQQRDTLYTYYCELTIGDTVLTSYEFVCENHIHKYDENYEFDEEEHWHGCTDENCPAYEESIVGGVHSFVEGLGCTVCGYGASVGILGDVNNDEKINQYDYILVKRHYFGTRYLTDDEMTRADVNGDGNVNQYDYILIKRHYFGTYVIGG